MGAYPLVELQNLRADGSDSLFGFPPLKVDKSVPLEKYFRYAPCSSFCLVQSLKSASPLRPCSVLSFAGGLTALFGVEYLDEGRVSSLE